MSIQTVCDIFYRSVETYRKPEHLKHKRDGAWRAIGSDELRAAVEEISMGLRGLGVDAESLLERADIEPTARAEQLSVEDFCRLAATLKRKDAK